MKTKFNIPLSRPSFCCAEYKGVLEVMKSGHVTTGPKTAEFEEKFAEYVGSKYAVFLNSCTSALKLAITWKVKDIRFLHPIRIAVPSLTFCATVNEVVENLSYPVFIDVNENDLCMDMRQAEKANCDLFLPVHLGANKVKYSGDKVIFDSAHLIERNCHVEGTISCYSFYPTKNISTFEGGMLCTDEKELYEWAIKARHHGRSKAIGSSDVEFISGKFNNTDVSAAVGLAQLEKLDEFNKRRNEIVDKYNEAFGYNWGGNHVYVLKVSDRKKFMKKMEDVGISTSIHFNPVHKMSAYKKRFGDLNLPVTNRVSEQIISLPLFPLLTNEEVEYICQEVKNTNLLLPLQD